MATAFEEDNLYEILGVPRTADQADIQAAFKKKARELHPDVNKAPDAEENFKRLNAAYAILKDEGKRARYDAFGIRGSGKRRPPTAPPKPRPRNPGPRPSPKPDNGVRFEDINVESEEFKNPFDFFLRREQARRKKKEEPEVQLSIPIAHSYTGTNLSVSVDLPGENGMETKKLKIKIPKGAKAGDRLKLKDPQIVVVLGFDEDPRFTVDGRDITMELSITPWEAALGDAIDFEAPGGTLKLKIPEGTSTGRRLRLRGQGIPLKPGKDGQPGDLYVLLRVVVPPTTTDAERELWNRLKSTSLFNPR